MKIRETLKMNQNPCGLVVDPLTEMPAMGNKQKNKKNKKSSCIY